MDYILAIIFALLGAFNLYAAIERFKRKAYFIFSLEMFLSIWMATCMILNIVKGFY